MIDGTYRQAFNSFTKTDNIGPFAQKRELTAEQVEEEINFFQESRERYESLDQGAMDKNPEPGAIKVATEEAFPSPPPAEGYEDLVNNLTAAIDDLGIGADTSNDFLHVKMDTNSVEVEETGTSPGVSFTRTEGDDIFRMDISYDGPMDVIQATHINTADRTGTTHSLSYLVPEETSSEPEGTKIVDLGSGTSLMEDENGVLRFDWG
jgi:hypothetical protein